MNIKVLQFLKCTLFILYFSVLVYLSCKDIKRYIDNEDSSSITYRNFNTAPQDKYPVVTICFDGKTKAWDSVYNKDVLRKHGFSVSEYWKLLTGRTNITISEMKKIPDFTDVAITLKDLTRKYQTMDRNGKFFNKFNSKAYEKSLSKENATISSKNKSILPFYLSYRNPNRICYSQRVEDNKIFIKSHDIILLDVKKLLSFNPPSDNYGRLHIFVHYQGQIVRSFGKEVFELPIKEDEIRKHINIRLSGFTVLRQRLDGKVKCNPYSEGDDARFRDHIIEKTKCVPPYWNVFYNSSSNLETCYSAEQLQTAFKHSHHRCTGRTLSKLETPCEEFSVTSSVDMRKSPGKNLLLSFQYRGDQYLEIRNMRDFGLISLWSSIGGLTGIFLGFSMFQMSEVMLNSVNELITRITIPG